MHPHLKMVMENILSVRLFLHDPPNVPKMTGKRRKVGGNSFTTFAYVPNVEEVGGGFKALKSKFLLDLQNVSISRGIKEKFTKALGYSSLPP